MGRIRFSGSQDHWQTRNLKFFKVAKRRLDEEKKEERERERD
jgi:hypothetical protein